MSRRVVLLLPRDVGDDAIDDAARALGLRLANIVPKAEGMPAQILFGRADGRATVAIVTDDRLARTYAVLDGELGEALARDLAARVGFERAT
ncbi:MAG TPA: hypothetical protein VL400_10850, partial [Polyangiaceae bacterium]|nr:hypothetical protein [Polyangiaceae bacterium]